MYYDVKQVSLIFTKESNKVPNGVPQNNVLFIKFSNYVRAQSACSVIPIL